MRIKNATSWKLAGLSALALIVGTGHPTEASTIYDENFGGGAVTLNATTPDTTTDSNTWTSAGSILENGSATGDPANAFLAFTPETGKEYTLTATLLDRPTGGSSSPWAAIGFTQTNTTNNAFWANNGGAWMLYRSDNGSTPGQVVSWEGPGLTSSAGEGTFDDETTLAIVLNTEAAAWTVEWFVNGGSVRSETYGSNPTINYVGLGIEDGASTTFSNFELTVVPEPGSLALIGLSGLCVLRRRRD